MIKIFMFVAFILTTYFIVKQLNSDKSYKENDVNNFSHNLPRRRFKDLVDEFGDPYFIVNKEGGMVLWRKPEFFQEIILRDESIEHTQPKSHCDYLYTTVKVYIHDYLIETIEKISDSISYDRLKKELTARCHFMGANVATLQLVMEVVSNPTLVDNLKKEYKNRIMSSMDKPHYIKMKKSLQIMVENNRATYYEMFPNENCV